MSDHASLVRSVKDALVLSGADLTGACGAFAITQRVAWTLRLDGAGLLDKSSGNNCRGYSTDVVMFRDGSAFDILGDAGGQNLPQWNLLDPPVDPARFRPAIDPGDAPPPPPPPPPSTIVPYDEAQVDSFVVDAALAYQEAHHTIDFGAARWIAQMQFDAAFHGYAAARAKQLAALRKQLGLPGAP